MVSVALLTVTIRGRDTALRPFVPDNPRVAEWVGVRVATTPQLAATFVDGKTSFALSAAQLFDELDNVADASATCDCGDAGNNVQLDRATGSSAPDDCLPAQ